MYDLEIYKEQLFTFNNPIFFGIVLSCVIILLVVVLYAKFIFPLQKKLINANQRYLLEKAELMALFSELDPEALLRIDENGMILQTNEAARQLFGYKSFEKIAIKELIPKGFEDISTLPENWTQEIKDQIFNINIRRENKLGFINIYLHDITKIKLYEKQLELYKSNLKTLTNLLDRQSEDLKKSIASQMHDDLGQRMVLLKLKLGQIDKYGIDDLKEDLDYLATSIREMSHKLAPINVKALGFIFNLKKIVSDISEASGLCGNLELVQNDKEFEDSLNENSKLLLLNCVQEALSNVVKHSQAKIFMVSIYLDDLYVKLSIADNGKGLNHDFDSLVLTNDSGIGLFRLRERVNNAGGEFKILSNDIYSTILQVKIPRG